MAKRTRNKTVKSETPVVEAPVVEALTVEETATAIADSEKPKKKRAERVSNVSHDVLVAAVVAGSIAGKTNEDVAKELGMRIKSFESRLSTVRKNYKEKKGFEVPCLGKGGGGKKKEISDDFIEKMRAMLAKAESQNETPDAETTDAETTAETAASE